MGPGQGGVRGRLVNGTWESGQDTIRRFGGSTAPSMPWPAEHEALAASPCQGLVTWGFCGHQPLEEFILTMAHMGVLMAHFIKKQPLQDVQGPCELHVRDKPTKTLG